MCLNRFQSTSIARFLKASRLSGLPNWVSQSTTKTDSGNYGSVGMDKKK